MPLTSLRAVLAAPALLLVLAGCSTYDTGYVFGACSARGVAVHGDKGDVGRVEATILGLRESTPEGRPAIDVRLRVERFGATPVVPPQSLRLVTANQASIDSADVRAIGPRVPASGGAATLEATFPLPARKAAAFDLSEVSLVVPLQVAGRAESVTLGFSRSEPVWFWPDPWEAGRDACGVPLGFRR